MTNHPPDLFAEFHYHDAHAGIAFLERAFGFERYAVFENDGGKVEHAELRIGNGFVMLAQTRESKYGYRVPRDIGGINTGSIYVGMPEVDEVYASAKAAGAEIVQDLLETDYGSRDFSARDPEQILWHFGTYRPTLQSDDPYGSPNTESYTGMRYKDAPAAIRWLGEAFGFEKHFVVPGEGGRIDHAQLRFGESIFMTGSDSDDRYKLRTPADIGGGFTHVICGYTADPDAHCDRARRRRRHHRRTQRHPVRSPHLRREGSGGPRLVLRHLPPGNDRAHLANGSRASGTGKTAGPKNGMESAPPDG